MIRKAVLVGCREGPWINIRDLVKPKLRVQAEAGTTLFLEYLGRGDTLNLNPGTHEIPAGSFIRASVAEGNHEAVLCDVVCHT